MASNMLAVNAGMWLGSHPVIGAPVGGALVGGAAGGYIGHKIDDEHGGAIGGIDLNLMFFKL